MIHNSQETGTSWMSIDGWTDKRNRVSTYNEIFFNLMNKPVACYNMDEPWGHYAMWDKPITIRHILCHSVYLN